MATSLQGSQPNFAAIIYASSATSCRKTAKIGRVLFEQIGPEGLVQTGSSFCTQGHPGSLRMVPFDRRQNFLYFLPTELYAYLVSFCRRHENEIAENRNWLLWQRPLRDQKSRFRSSSAATAEPNAENRVKIRPVEVEIIVLTELTLSRRQVSGDKYLARSGANAVPRSKRTKRLVRLLIDIHVGSAAA